MSSFLLKQKTKTFRSLGKMLRSIEENIVKKDTIENMSIQLKWKPLLLRSIYYVRF